ncbi:hypothetical protein [Verrucosispora sp. TAA-831]|uniref:hypothetical protein n=1 Tax=Verrucosispora sp. TAA-831 TaxID=3422227 RepID=UPI003D6E0030
MGRRQPSRAAIADHLAPTLRAYTLTVDPARWVTLALPPDRYWQERAALPWI